MRREKTREKSLKKFLHIEYCLFQISESRRKKNKIEKSIQQELCGRL